MGGGGRMVRLWLSYKLPTIMLVWCLTFLLFRPAETHSEISKRAHVFNEKKKIKNLFDWKMENMLPHCVITLPVFIKRVFVYQKKKGLLTNVFEKSYGPFKKGGSGDFPLSLSVVLLLLHINNRL